MTTDLTCSVCEKRPSIRNQHVPICLACFSRGRMSRPEPGPVVVSSSPSAESLLRDHQVRVALGLAEWPAGAA
jgi:hypothetical protein